MAPKDVEQAKDVGPDRKGSDAREKDRPAPIYRPDSSAQSFLAGLYSWLQPVLFALSVLFVVSTFLGRLIGVEGDSMVPTLHDRDMLILQSVGYTPRNGDIVVLAQQSFRGGRPIVKRVIATGGQQVDIDYAANTVTVDGEVLDERPYLGDTVMQEKSWTVNNHVRVPEGFLFVLGDNRNNSTDSRSTEVGLVDARCVLGRAVWSLSPFGRIGG